MAPNHSFIVQQAAREYAQLLETNDYPSIYRFMVEILGPRMAAHDPNWGFLTKLPAEKHLTLIPGGQLIGVDAFCYRPGEEVIDVLTNALDPGPSGPAWQPKERRPTSHWYQIAPGSGNGGGGGDNGDNDQDAAIAQLQRQVAIQGAQIQGLQDQLARLEAQGLEGRKIALRSVGSGFLLCADGNSQVWDIRDSHNQRVRGIPTRILQAFDRTEPGSWEEFIILDRGR